MKTIVLSMILTLCLGAVAAELPLSTTEPPKIPNSWFNKAKGYEKALALQKETGADIFVVFTRDAPANEKGLCHWFDAKGLRASKVSDLLRDYIKVTVPLPSNPECQNMAKDFNVRKCPAVFIVQPNGKRSYCKVFEFLEGERPKLYPPETLVELFLARSSERYQPADSPETTKSKTK